MTNDNEKELEEMSATEMLIRSLTFWRKKKSSYSQRLDA